MNVLVAALKSLVTRARRELVVTEWSRIDGRTCRYQPAARITNDERRHRSVGRTVGLSCVPTRVGGRARSRRSGRSIRAASRVALRWPRPSGRRRARAGRGRDQSAHRSPAARRTPRSAPAGVHGRRPADLGVELAQPPVSPASPYSSEAHLGDGLEGEENRAAYQDRVIAPSERRLRGQERAEDVGVDDDRTTARHSRTAARKASPPQA